MPIMVEATCDVCNDGYVEVSVGIDDGVNALESQLDGSAYFDSGRYVCGDCAPDNPKE